MYLKINIQVPVLLWECITCVFVDIREEILPTDPALLFRIAVVFTESFKLTISQIRLTHGTQTLYVCVGAYVTTGMFQNYNAHVY